MSRFIQLTRLSTPKNLDTTVIIARGNHYRVEKKTGVTLARVGGDYGGCLKGSESARPSQSLKIFGG